MAMDAQTAASGIGAQSPPPAVALGAISYGPAMVRENVAAIEAAQREKEAKQAPIYAQMQADVAKDRAREQQIDATYAPVEITKPPPPPENDPLKGFASAAGLFAMLASSLTHAPAINAMNGMAAAINATKANDWKAYEEGYKQWKENTDLAIEKHKLQAADMQAALEKMQTDLSTGVAMAKAVAAASDDRIATKLLEEGEYEKLGNYQRASAEAAAHMQESALRIQELMPGAIASQRMTAALKSGDPAQIAAATTMLAEVHDPAGFAAQTSQKQARVIAADPTSYKDGKLTDDAFQKMMSFDPALAINLRKSGIEKSTTPQTYRLPGGATVTVVMDANGANPREVGTNRPIDLNGAVKAGTDTAASGKEQDARTEAREKFKELHDRDPTPADEPEMAKLRMTTRMDVNGVITDEAADFVAGRVLAGDERATVGMARSAANMTKVTNEIIKSAKAQGLSPNDVAIRIAEFQGTIAGERTLGTRAANMETAANVVRRMVPVALDASEKVDRTQFPTLNAVIIAADRGTGGEDVVRFGQAANAIIYEYSKFLNPTGIPTDADKARATDILNTAWSNGQFAAALDQIANKEIPAGAAGITDTRREFRAGLGTAQTTPPSPSGASVLSESGVPIPKEAQDMLRADPNLAKHFDEVFGAGAAARVLGH